jgi:formylglycine-generating enzyme required for sulfatase activity
MNMLKTMDLKSEKKFLSSMIAVLLLCITPFSFQFCQKISLANVPHFIVNPDDCSVTEIKNFTETVSNVSFKMVFVKGDTFWMGSQSSNSGDPNYDLSGKDYNSNEKPVHRVVLSDYYISNTEITQELWFTVMKGKYDNQVEEPGVYVAYNTGRGANYPACRVSWEDIVGTSENSTGSYVENGVTYYSTGFCYKLSELANGGSLVDGGRRYSLPTEAEWEYAARGGNKSQSKQGNGSDYTFSGNNTATRVAWHSANNSGSYGDTTYGSKKVGRLLPNELDLYDMSGNLWEWCSDIYSSYSSDDLVVDPVGPSGSSSSRVLRGGNWGNLAGGCRVSSRDSHSTGGRDNSVGFRVRCRF